MTYSNIKIGVFAPSSWVEKDSMLASQEVLRNMGIEVEIHPQTYLKYKQSAGTSAEKLKAFHELCADDSITHIWAASGGNRCLHWIDDIDYDALTTEKTIIGFSDVTALLNTLYAHKGFHGIHGQTFGRFKRFPQQDELLALIRGEKFSYHLEEAQILKEGSAEGHLIGGNLALFQYLPQTLPGEFWKDGILFIEDWNEELSRIDRMMLNLKRCGVYKQVKGIIFGEFSRIPEECGTPFEFTLEELIMDHTDGLDIPILTNAFIGHGENLYPLPLGKRVRMDGKTISSL